MPKRKRKSAHGFSPDNTRTAHNDTKGEKSKGHWNPVWYPALAGALCNALPTLMALLTIWHAVIAGALVVPTGIYLALRKLARSQGGPRWILTPKHGAKPAIIEVYRGCASVTIGKASYLTQFAPTLEYDHYGTPHLAEIDSELLCFTDNLPRAHLLLIRSEKRNGEYVGEIRRNGKVVLRGIFTLNV